MKRVADPEIRKAQILKTAMKLFYEKGYDNTSLDEIAKELNVVKGLCYRYYDSKQALFEEVLEEYTKECCCDFVKIIHDRGMSINKRLTTVLELLLDPPRNGKYHNLFHKQGNESMHEQLAARMCKYMLPHVTEELEYLTVTDKVRYEDPGLLAEFILYGMIGIWQESRNDSDNELRRFAEILNTLLNIQQNEA